MLRKALILAAIAIVAILGWRWYSAEQEAKLGRALATNTASVLSVTFQKERALKVYSARGTLIASNRDVNAAGLSVTQTTTAPFSVDYFVDLARVDQRRFRWDKASKTMFVEIPDVTTGEPNVDERRAKVEQQGLWVSREAGQRLRRASATALAQGAKDAAQKPERLEAARQSAVEAVAELTEASLAAAGLTDIRVIVRFPFERRSSEEWDRSTPLSEVLGTS